MNRTLLHKSLLLVVETVLLSLIILSCGGDGDDPAKTQDPPIFSPAVFIADKDSDGIDELYAAFDDGTEIVKLSNKLVAGGEVVAFLVSPDGFFVAYVADQDTDDVFELYAVVVDKTTGDSAVKVSGTMAGSGLLQLPSGDYVFGWAPSSSRVAYIADQNTAGVFELFTSTPNGIEKDRVSGGLVAGGDVHFFQWEPDSTLIAYVADQDTDSVIELYVSPSNNNLGNVRVSGGMAAGGDIKELPPAASGRYAFNWAPDSSRIAYLADQKTADDFELFTSTPDGTVNLTISNIPVSDGRDVVAFAWAPNSQKIAYTANQNLVNAIDLYTAAPDASGSPLQISSGMSPGQQAATFKWAPNSIWVSFISDKDITGFFLYTTSPNNNNNIFISGSIASPYNVSAFKWAPNAAFIAFVVEVPGNIFQLFTTVPDLAPSMRISVDLFDGDEEGFKWAPDSSRIAYIADQDTAGVFELFTSVADGSVIDAVSSAPVIEGDVLEFKWSPDSSALGYLADQDINGIIELFASLPNGNENTKLSGTLVNGGDVFSFDWVP